MRILVVGAGAAGGYYGGRVALAGRDVTFLVRGKRMAQLQSDGLRIAAPDGEATLSPVQVITAADLSRAKPFDVVMVSTKAYSLRAAMDDFAPAVGANTVVLPILNGLAHLDILGERFGKERVMAGTVRVVSDMEPDGLIRQMTRLDNFTFGEIDGSISPRAEAMREAFDVPGITLKLTDNVMAAMWEKWWILAAMGAVGVLAGGTVGEIVATGKYGLGLARGVQREGIEIATKNGYPADPKVMEQNDGRMTAPGSGLTSSMYRDMLKGLPVEADHILGDLLARAQGVYAPLLEASYTHLKVYEAKRGN